MRPLNPTKFQEFSKRFNFFIDAEIRSIIVKDATTFELTFALQDEARAFDWITLVLEFSDVNGAKLLEDSQLSFVDMSEGFSLFTHNDMIYFGIGKELTPSLVESASLYIKAKNLKYQEGQF
jgi:hypothetical protein